MEMKLAQYNGYIFDINTPGYQKPEGATSQWVTIFGIDYDIVCHMNDISEELSKEIHPTKIVTTHVPRYSKFTRPECSIERYATHKEALIRYLEFNHKLKVEDTVVLKKKEVQPEESLQKVYNALQGMKLVNMSFANNISSVLLEKRIAHEKDRYMSPRSSIPVLTNDGIAIVDGLHKTKTQVYSEIYKVDNFKLVKGIVVIVNREYRSEFTFDTKPGKTFKIS